MRHKGREVVYVERGDSSAKWLFWGALLGAGIGFPYPIRTVQFATSQGVDRASQVQEVDHRHG